MVTFGDSGLDRSVLLTRLKRWLVAGLDDAEWGTEEKRACHVGMGHKHLIDFKEGLSDEAMDEIISALPAR